MNLELEALIAAQKLVDKLSEVERHPEWVRVFNTCEQMGQTYNGPVYGAELYQLKQLLKKVNVVQLVE